MTELPRAGPRPAISEVTAPKLAAWLAARGEPVYRPRQVMAGIHRPEVSAFADLTELPRALRSELGSAFRFSTIALSHVIEADGGQHAESETDASRTQWLEAHGWRVLRFWNNEILHNRDGVVETILRAIEEASPSP